MGAVVVDLTPQIDVLQECMLGLTEEHRWLKHDGAVWLFSSEIGVVVSQLSQAHASPAVHLDYDGFHDSHSNPLAPMGQTG